MIVHADTPIKRIGFLLVILSMCYWLVMALHWNIYRNGFIYKYWEEWTEQAPKPPDNTIALWVRGEETLEEFIPSQAFLLDERPRRSGWVSYDKACLKAYHKPTSIFDSYPSQCRNKILPDEVKSKHIWRQSFTNFLDNLFSTYSGGHFKLSIIFSILMIPGFLMSFGVVDKGLQWIMSGKMEK